MKVLLPDTIHLELPGVDAELVEYGVHAPLPDRHHDAEVLVLWQNPQERVEEMAAQLAGVRLVQTLAAGPDAALRAGFVDDATIASGRSLHDATVAEHALALTLSLVRRLDVLQDEQRHQRWSDAFIAAQQDAVTERLYTLVGSAVTIWGFGAIASQLAPLLTALGAEVVGVARKAGRRDGYPVIAAEDLEERLAVTDILISILPATPSTFQAMNRHRFQALREGALFVNVGRGTTVDERELASALRRGTLRAAAIDVMQTEPLPPKSELWGVPNLTITPHVAGNRPRGASVLLSDNVVALENGTPLRNVVAR